MNDLPVVFALVLFARKAPKSAWNTDLHVRLVCYLLLRMQHIKTDTPWLRMATAPWQHLCLRLSLQVLHPLRPQSSSGSSGGASMSSCSPALDTAWDWGTCGVSRTSATGTEEVSSCKKRFLFSEASKSFQSTWCLRVCVCVSAVIWYTYLGRRPFRLRLWVCVAPQQPQALRSWS